MQHRVLLFCLVLSGFTGLSYELLWVRLLTSSFGSTTLSFSTVLAVFFGGLALGSWLAGRNLHRVRRPIRAYAFIELITGLTGIALFPVLQRLPNLFALIDPGPTLMGALMRFVVAMPLLLVPTVLMGATLPLICAAVIKEDQEIGHGTGLIYGFNTLGAFLGVYMITYHMLHALGVWHSILLTALVNLAVFSIAIWESGRTPPTAHLPGSLEKASLDSSSSGPDAAHRKLVTVATVLTFLTGFSFICYEIVWARLFSTFLGGTIFGVGAVLICFLVGIAIGSILVAPRADGVDAGKWFVGTQLVSAAGVLLVSGLLPRVSYELAVLHARPDRASLLPQHLQLLVVFASLAVPTIAAGAAFPLLIRAVTAHASQSGRSLGLLYSSNTVGSISGSLLTGFVLIPFIGSEATSYLGLLITVAVAAIAAVFLMHGPRSGRLIAVLSAVVLLLAYPGLDLQELVIVPSSKASYPAAKAQRAQTQKRTVYFAEGPSAVVTVAGVVDESLGLQLNALGQGGVNAFLPRYPLESALVAFVPLVHRPEARTALVVGFGAGATVDLLARQGLDRVTVLELEPKVIDAAEVLFQGKSPLRLPNVSLEVNDARHFLLVNQRRRGGRFDLIASMPAHPWVASPIFTREFFELAKASLTPDGVFSTWFGIGGMDSLALRSVVAAFVEVFEHHLVYWVPESGAYFLVGSAGHIRLSTVAAQRLGMADGFKDYPELRDRWFLPARFAGLRQRGSEAGLPSVVNTDDSAFVEVHSPRSATTAATLGELLPSKFMSPEVLVPGTRDHYLELAELLLGTPGGMVPMSPRPLRLEHLKALLEGVGGRVLQEEDRAYLRGRVALAERQTATGLDILKPALESSDQRLRSRVRKFYALAAFKDSPELGPALSELPFSPDIGVRLFEIDRSRAIAYVKTSTTPLDQAGALEWSLRVMAEVDVDPRLNPGSQPMYSRFREGMGQAPPRGIAEECLQFARRSGLGALVHFCASALDSAKETQRNRLLSEGRKHGGAGRFDEAAQALKGACELDYRDLSCIRLLLIALLESGQADQVSSVLREAEIWHPIDVLQSVLSAAQASASAGKAFDVDGGEGGL